MCSLLYGMLVHRSVTPRINFAGTHLYFWVERGTVRVKCLAQEHDTICPARTRTQTAKSLVERTNHEDTARRMSLKHIFTCNPVCIENVSDGCVC